MIRPYLAIIKDAFRATIASKVLYVMIGLIFLILLALAPLHLRETLDWELSFFGVQPVATDIVLEMVEKKDLPRQPVVARIWDRLPSDSQTMYLEETRKAKAKSNTSWSDSDETVDGAKGVEIELDSSSRGKRRKSRNQQSSENFTLARRLADDLNNLMKDRQFYDADVWKTQVLHGETQELVDEGVDKLTNVRAARLNRLLLNNALKSLPTPGKSSVKVYYAIWHFSIVPADVTRFQVVSFVNSVLRLILDKFVLSLGILIAIIVTANMIPETFEPGSLNLLLSKPIHRFGLLMSKFVGGTVFVALCGAILFLGVYFWMGLGLGLWDRATLYSIPLYVVVFAIYFSVSVFVGLLYRSAIVAVVLTGVFWAACFAIGTANNFFASSAENQQMTWGREIDGEVFAINKFAELFHIKNQTWTPVPRSGSTMSADEQMGLAVAKNMANLPTSPFSEPIVDSKTGRMVIAFSNPLGLPGIPNSQLSISNPGKTLFNDYSLYDSLAVFANENGPLLVSSGGRISRLDLSKVGTAPATTTGARTTISDDMLTPLGPDRRIDLREASRVDYNPLRNEFVMLSGKTLFVIAWRDQEYRLAREVEVDSGSDRRGMSAHVAFGKDHIAVAFGNARVLVFDADSLKQVAAFQPESRSPPITLRGDKTTGQIGILYRNRRLWMWDPAAAEDLKLASAPGQGTISGFSFDRGQLTICHHIDRVSKVSTNGSFESTHAPQGGFLLNAYRYVLQPVYMVFPKPGEFYRLVDYLSSSRDTRYDANVDLREVDEHRDPWSPLRSGLYFMALMLGISCIYFSRLDC